MGKTSIEWAEHSVNPLRARLKDTCYVGHYCEKVGQGCKHCYSSAFQPRFHMPQFQEQRGNDSIEHFLDATKLEEVLQRKVPTRYFWCSMTDLFGTWVPDAWIQQCFRTMVATPQHIHMVLTKRAPRLTALAFLLPWPANVWLGVSVESAAYTSRIDHLRTTPAAVKFLSLEPLLGPLPHLNLAGIGQVIVGGESGPGARPMALDWVRDIRDQCLTAGVSFFFKQIGGVHKKQTGRMLDGRTWDEMPGVVPQSPQLALALR